MSDRVKIQIVPLGDWKGHSAGEQHYGEAEALAMVERANRVVSESGNPLQIDYEHASLDPPATGAPAAGWMHSFTLENDGIWAEVEWTPKAKEFIKNGEYKYISPVICSGLPDPVTGDEVPIELFNAALTNQPFMHDKIQQVVASAVKAAGYASYFTNTKSITITNSQGGPKMAPEEIVPAMAQAAGLPATATVEELESLLKAVKQFMTVMPGAPASGMPTPDQMGEMETEMKQQMVNSKTLTEVAALLSVTPDKVLPTVAAMSNRTTDSDALKTELEAVKSRLLEREVADLITANATKIAPAKREFWANHAKTHGVEATKAVLAELPDVIPTEQKPDHKTSANTEKPTPEFIAFRKKKGRTDEQIAAEWANLKLNTKEA